MYKISIMEVTDYPEVERVYETVEGKRLRSSYDLEKNTYKSLDIPTGAILQKEREVYSQEFEATDIKEVIKAVNNIK